MTSYKYVLKLIENDSYAVSFQTIGQYRQFLINHIRELENYTMTDFPLYKGRVYPLALSVVKAKILLQDLQYDSILVQVGNNEMVVCSTMDEVNKLFNIKTDKHEKTGNN